MYEDLLPRFLRYVKTETRSDVTSTTTPSTQIRVAFARTLRKELEELGMSDVIYSETNSLAITTLPSNMEEDIRSIGFIIHMDTADFNAVSISPQIVGSYDEESTIPLDREGKFTLDTRGFPNLKNCRGGTLITTDGTTLLGTDDKSGIAEITTAMEYLVNHPETKHGTTRVAFGLDEEIGVSANRFDVAQFNVDFAYTVDDGPVGELQFETSNTVQAEITIQEKNIHPGTARNTMINALQLGINFHNALPVDEVPEKTAGEEGLYHLAVFTETPEEAIMACIIHDHNHEIFEARKAKAKKIQQALNAPFDEERTKVDLLDQYYNIQEVIERDISIVKIARQAMEELSIQPIIEPVHGGTDDSRISYLGIPTPNIFAGDESMHGRSEFVSLQVMGKTTNTIIKITELDAK